MFRLKVGLWVPKHKSHALDMVNALRNASVRGAVFNQYAEACPLLDADESPAEARCRRLELHLNCQPRLILLGEAAGYQGCRYSGITFTSERLLIEGVVPRLGELLRPVGRITTRKKPFSEPSATIVWRTLNQLGIADRAVMWNSLPFHPYRSGEPLSNRTPSDKELGYGLQFLELLINRFSGVPVVAVGKKAEEALGLIGLLPAACVRHPANGGATKFKEQLAAFVGETSF